jgi:hypothetical protein
MPGSRQVPDRVYALLQNGFVLDTARDLLKIHADQRVLHPGDAFGEVLTWLWRTDPDRAIAMVRDLLAEVRYHSPDADRSITLGQLLGGVRFSLHAMPDSEFGELMARARREVPDWFDPDVTSRPGEG